MLKRKARGLIWGMGHKGQLGLGEAILVQPTPANIDFSFGGRENFALRIHVGPNHAVIDSSGEVYAFGRNCCGQLGVGDHNDRFTASQVPLFSQQERSSGAIVVGIGSYHTVLATNGKVYSFGRGKRGQTGRGNTEDVWSPAEIPSLAGMRIKKIVGGEDFTVVVTSEPHNAIYTFGNASKLGYAATSDVLLPTKVALPSPLLSVEDLACGWGHSIMLVKDENKKHHVYTWGSNKHGQCGVGTKEDISTPVKLASLANQNVVRIAAGASHSLAVTEDSQVYIWGSHRDGKLGLGEKIDKDVLEPHRLPSFLSVGERIKDVSCGADHSAVLADDNQVFLWGFGQHGTLGFKQMKNEAVPRRLDLRSYLDTDEQVTAIHCGMDITLAMVETRVEGGRA